MELAQGTRWITYLKLRLKIALRLLPPVLIVSLLLLLALGLLGLAAGQNRAEDRAWQKVAVGVVFDPSDRYLDAGLTALETMDRSREALTLLRTDEATARELLRRGELDAYLAIPDGFIQALARGETRPIRYVSGGGQAGLSAALADELVKSVATLLLQTENAIYGAQSYAAEQLPGTDPYAVGDELTGEYLHSILDRDSLYVTETVGIGAGLDFFTYYLCALLLLFLLLWGLLASPLLSGERIDARRRLAASGFGALSQLLCEYLAYVVLTLICFAAVLAAVTLAAALIPALNALLPARPARLLVYPLRALLPLLVFAAVQMLFFELGAGSVGALLLQFLAAAAMAFVSGCFYPSSMLPAGMQALGRFLPPGAGMDFLAAPSGRSALLLLAWLLLCLALLWLRRRRRLEGGGA